MERVWRRSAGVVAACALAGGLSWCDESRRVETKVLIVGGGIVGASLAYQAGKLFPQPGPSKSVVLLDKRTIGSEATGLSAGTLFSSGAHGRTADVLERLRSSTSKIYRELQSRGSGCGYVQSGAILIATDDNQLSYLRCLFEKTHTYKDRNAEFLETYDAVVKVEPSLAGGSVVGGIHYPESGYVEPMEAAHAFLDAAVENVQVIFHESAEVVQIDQQEDGKYVVHTKNGMEIQCETLVLSAGAWTRNVGLLLGLHIPVYPVKGQIWVTEEVPNDFLRKVIFIAESGMAFSKGVSEELASVPRYCTHDLDGRQHVRHAYGRRLGDGRVIFGGDRMFCGSSHVSHLDLYGVDTAQVAKNQQHVYEFCPQLRQFQVEGAWAGPMPFSMDGLPIVGHLGEFGHPNAWVVSGLGPHGVMESPAITKLVAEAIATPDKHPTGLANVMFETFSPARKNCVRLATPQEVDQRQHLFVD